MALVTLVRVVEFTNGLLVAIDDLPLDRFNLFGQGCGLLVERRLGGAPGWMPLRRRDWSVRYCLTMIGPLHSGPASVVVAPPTVNEMSV